MYYETRTTHTVLLTLYTTHAHRGLYEMGEYAFLGVYRDSPAMTLSALRDPGNGMVAAWIILAAEWPLLLTAAWAAEMRFGPRLCAAFAAALRRCCCRGRGGSSEQVASCTGHHHSTAAGDGAEKERESVVLQPRKQQQQQQGSGGGDRGVEEDQQSAVMIDMNALSHAAAAAGTAITTTTPVATTAAAAKGGQRTPPCTTSCSAVTTVDLDAPDVAAERARVTQLPLDGGGAPIVARGLAKTYPGRDGEPPKARRDEQKLLRILIAVACWCGDVHHSRIVLPAAVCCLFVSFPAICCLCVCLGPAALFRHTRSQGFT